MNAKVNSNLGDRIKMIRIKNSMTLEEFGKEILNANKSLVSKWERNLTIPNNERLNKIAELGKVTTEFLLSGDPFDNLSPDEQEAYFEGYNLNLEIEAYRKMEFPDIEELLKSSSVYFAKKPLNKAHRELILKVIHALTDELEENYPSDEKIEQLYQNLNKAAEIAKNKLNKK